MDAFLSGIDLRQPVMPVLPDAVPNSEEPPF